MLSSRCSVFSRMYLSIRRTWSLSLYHKKSTRGFSSPQYLFKNVSFLFCLFIDNGMGYRQDTPCHYHLTVQWSRRESKARPTPFAMLKAYAENRLVSCDIGVFCHLVKTCFLPLCKIVKGYRHRLVNVSQKLRKCKFSVNCIEKRN